MRFPWPFRSDKFPVSKSRTSRRNRRNFEPRRNLRLESLEERALLSIVSLTANDPDASENPGSPGQFTVTRTTPIDTNLFVYYAVSGTATNGTDYTSLPGYVLLSSGSASATINLTVTNDATKESAETAILTLSTNANYTIGSPSSGTVTIADNDQWTVSITATDANAAETGSGQTANPGQFTVTRAGETDLTNPLTVWYTTSGTATNNSSGNGGDYQVSGYVIIPANSTTATIDVTPFNDRLKESAETAIVTLSTNSNYTVGASNSATVTIADNDQWTVSITANDASASEAGGDPGQFTITRSGETDLDNYLFVYYTVGGTATNGTDYTSISSYVMIPAGSTSATVNVAVTNDALKESAETVILTLSTNSYYTVGSPNNATVTISDNDQWSVKIEATDASAGELGTSEGTNPGQFKVTRYGETDLSNAMTVYYSRGGTATSGDDYTGPTGSVTIPANSDYAYINVNIVNDDDKEGNETLVLTLTASANYYAIGSPSNATVTIDDNDEWTVGIVTFDGTVEETESGAFAVVRYNETDTTYPLYIWYTVSGTATNGTDYTNLPGYVQIPAGATSAIINLTVTNDALKESDETAILTLNTNSSYTVGDFSSSTITIADNDQWTVSIAANDANAGELGSGQGTNPGQFTVTRAGETDLTNPMTVYYTIGGTATNGTDYASISSAVTIPAGATTAPVNINVTNDSDKEGNETVVLTLSASNNYYTVGSPSNATVTIDDNDDWVVAITANDATASEQGTNPGQYTVTRSGETDTTYALYVWYTVSGTATNGTDYTSLPGYVLIPSGATTATINVTVTNDALKESAETVILTLSTNSNYTVGSPNNATVTISDNDQWSVKIEATDASAGELGTSEGTNPGQFKVTRYGETDLSNAMTVYYSRGGTATSGDDYTGPTGSVTIPANSDYAYINVNIVNDDDKEGNETLVLTLTASANYYAIGSPSNATVTIDDNDEWAVAVLTFDATAAETGSGQTANPGTFTIVRYNETDTTYPLYVWYTISGTATSGDDYTSLPSYVQIPAGATLVTLDVTPINDNLREDPETVILTLSTGFGTYTAPDYPTATVTIQDNDQWLVKVEATDATAAETGSGETANPGRFTITRYNETDLTYDLYVQYTISGTATDTSDYAHLATSLTIPAGSASAVVDITPVNDSLKEGSETIVLTLTTSYLTHYTIGTPAAATVTLQDNDEWLVKVETTDSTVAEPRGGGAVPGDPGQFRITRYNQTDTTYAITVAYTLSGTATNGSDYQSLNGSVTIPAGATSATVALTPLEDTLGEGNETVVLTLGSGSTYIIGSPASASLSIEDDPSDLPYDPAHMIGEFGQQTLSQDVADQWHTVTLRGTYVDPVVIMQPLSYNGVQPAMVRIRNVSSNSFEMKIDEWDYQDGTHVSETVAYLVVEKGAHVLLDGTRLIVGQLSTTTSWAGESYPIDLTTAPVLLTQVQTSFDSAAVVTRQRNATAQGFEVRLQEEEAADGVHAAELLGYMAIELTNTAPRSFENKGIRIEAGHTATAVTENPYTITFDSQLPFRTTPVLLASTATFNDSDPVNLRYSDPTATNVVVREQEEQSVAGSDLTHGAEGADYLALEFAGWVWRQDDQPPVVANQTFHVDENSLEGTEVGHIVATDANPLDRLSYSVISGNEAGVFTIDQENGTIRVANSSLLNHELQATYALSLVVTDSSGLSDPATITIQVNDLPERPVIADHSFSIDENRPNGTLVGTVPATDEDAGQTITLSILSGNEDGIFAINPSTGAITVADSTRLNYEALSVHHLTVRALDNDNPPLSSTAAVTITLNDVNEAPAVLDQTVSVAENSPNGTSLGRVVVSFLDAGETPSFAIISGNEQGTFAVDAATGELTVADSSTLNFEAGPITYNLVVRVTDSGTPPLSSDAAVTIHVQDVNETPLLADQLFQVNENQPIGSLVGSVVASDPDPADTLRYAITAGNYGILGPDVFAIDPETGALRVADPSQLNHEVTDVYELVVEVTDNGSGALRQSAIITIQVADVNEAPLLGNQNVSLGETALNNTLVATATAQDPDAGETFSYAITAGNDLGAFSIDSSIGEIRVADRTKLVGVTSFSLTVQAQDSGGLSGAATVTIEIQAGAPSSITLEATFRDFHARTYPTYGHPDFEGGVDSVAVHNLVGSTLGLDGKPVFTGTPGGTGHITSAASFNQWYNDVPNINLSTTKPLVFTQSASDPKKYVFTDTTFWPLDGELFNQAGSPSYEQTYSGHNFHFTMEIHASFTYRAGQSLGIYESDDDLWIYINNQIVVDLGGVHAPLGQTIDLSTLGLVEGQTYPLDMFYAERHTVQSDLNVWTTIEDLKPVQSGYQIVEEDRFRTDDTSVTNEPMRFFVPSNPSTLAFSFDRLNFDLDDPASINDAFELALVDQNGNSLVPTIGAGRNAFFNLTEGEEPQMAEGVGMLDANTVVVDISHLTPGIQPQLLARLVNNDGVSNGYSDQATEVWISGGLRLLNSWPLPVAQEGAFPASAGQVVVEAENFTGYAVGSGTAAGHAWTTVSDTLASGGTALATTPNTGVDTGDATTGPRRDYALELATPGDYYVWARLQGASTSSNAVNLGLDGTLLSTGGLATTTTGSWQWVKLPTALSIASAGIHVLNLWMREDGTQVDKLLLTTDADFTPSDLGPDESLLDPVPPVAPPDLWMPREADFALLSEVTAGFDVSYGRTSLNDATNVLYANVTLTNNGLYQVRGDQGPLLLGVTNLSDPTVSLYEPDGVTPDGIPYFDISQDAFTGSDDRLVDGDTVGGIELRFSNPNRVQFRYDLVVLGALNRAPVITSTPIEEVSRSTLNTSGYAYAVVASDPDGDTLSYTFLDAPSDMTISNAGVISWTPDTALAGNYHVTVVATDPQGAAAAQEYTLQVKEIPNRPPAFTTNPVIDAYAGVPYVYAAAAFDPDGDTLHFEDASPNSPSGFTVDGQTGQVSWTPSASMANQYALIQLRVEDRPDGASDQLYATQWYLIHVLADPANHDPLIVSEPSTFYKLPGENSPASGTVSPTSLELDLGPGEATTTTVHVTVPTGPTPSLGADVIFVVDESGSMYGEHAWLKDMVVDLQNALVSRGVLQNRYGLVGFGGAGSKLSPHAYLVGGQMFGTATDFGLSTSQLVTTGDTEDGWFGLNYALNGDASGPKYLFRDGAAVNVILVTDEERDWVNGGLTYGSVLESLNAKDAILNVVTDATYKNASQVTALGVDAEGNALVPDGAGGYTSTPGYQFVHSYFPQILNDYVNMAWATHGATWDLTQLRAGGLLAESFTKAFVDIKAEEIESRFAIDVIANNPTFTNLTGQLVGLLGGQTASFDVQFLGNGQSHAFDLQFVRAGTGVVIGSIPVTINAPEYIYDVDAIDADAGDVLTYSLVGDSHGAQINTSTGLLTWNPVASGSYQFTAQVSDGHGGVDTQTWTVEVGTTSTGNHDPLITSAPVVEGYANQPYQYQITASDIDGDPLSYYLVGTPPQGMVVDSSTGIVSWSNPSYGTYTVTLRVADGRGGYANQLYQLSIGDRTVTNRDPVIDSVATTAAVVDELYRYQVHATDPDADPLTYDLVTAPDGMSIDPQTGMIAWKPGYLQAGLQDVIVRASDAWGGSGLQGFQINVISLNDPPKITSVPYGPAGLNVEWTYQIQAQDPNGDVLVYRLDPNWCPAGMTIDEATGLVRWTPTALGDYRVFVSVDDGRGGIDVQGFILPVSDNAPPKITSIPQTVVLVGTNYSYAITVSDPNAGDTVTVELDAASLERGMTLDASNTLHWTPRELGDYEVSITARDGDGAGYIQRYTLHVVEPASKPPVFTSTPKGPGIVGQQYVYELSGYDPDAGDTVTFTLDEGPTASAVNLVSGKYLFTWTPTSAGTFHISIQATDNHEAWTKQSFDLPVIQEPEPNDPPAIRSVPTGPAYVGQAWSYTIDAYDPNGDALVLSLDEPSRDRGLTLVGNTVSWTPSLGGEFQIYVRATDEHGAYCEQTITLPVVVTPPNNDAPVITSKPTGPAYLAHLYTYWVEASDPNGDPITFSVDEASYNRGVRIDSSGRLTWTPAQTGEYLITIHAEDPNGAWQEQQFQLPVVPGVPDNKPPVIESIPPSPARVGELYQYQVLAYDPNGEALTYLLAAGPTGMTLSHGGLLQFLPEQIGSFDVKLIVQDPGGAQMIQTFTVPVTTNPANNQPPTITSSPLGPAVANSPYRYQVTAEDPNGDTILYSLDDASLARGATINPTTGLLAWTPTRGGTFHFVVTASDGSAACTQTFDLPVIDNAPPRITSTPPQSSPNSQTYSYAVLASDPNPSDADTLVYSLHTNATGMTINASTGVVTWTTPAVGIFDVEVRVSDDDGASATQSYSLQIYDPNVNHAPTINTLARATIQAGQTYLHQINASDADGDRLSYVLESGPAGLTMDSGGLVRWVTDANDINSVGSPHIYRVHVVDSRGAVSSSVDFPINVILGTTPNSAPVFDPNVKPLASALVNQPYQYQPVATDPDGDLLTWSLTQAPQGMSINATTGRITWTPVTAQLGPQAVTIRVNDPFGASATQSFTLTVQSLGMPPRITSIPDTLAIEQQAYSYKVVGADDDTALSGLTISLVSGPTGMTASASGSGWKTFTWTPPAGSARTEPYIVEVSVSDGFWWANQRYGIVVTTEAGATNKPPAITSTPVSRVAQGGNYSYQVAATDDQPGTLSYSREVDAALASKVTIDAQTGLLTWNNVDVPGSHTIKVIVTDAGGLWCSQTYTLVVATNSPPTIDSLPITEVTGGMQYRYNVVASDADSGSGDVLSYRLANVPTALSDKLTIDPYGRIRWLTTTADIGIPVAFDVVVTDRFNKSATQHVSVTVVGDTEAPLVSVLPNVNMVTVGGSMTFTITATDNVGVVSQSLTVRNVATQQESTHAVDLSGKLTLPFPTAGTYQVTATARDAANNTGTSQPITVLITDPNNQSPQVTILAPTGDVAISQAVDILGTISDPNNDPVTYTIALVALDPGTANNRISLGSFSGARTNAALGAKIDPAVLPNGSYRLEVTATDGISAPMTASRTIQIASDLKLGDFNLAFVDLEIPVGGISISVTRSYDTFRAGQQGEFGYGWKLELPTTHVEFDYLSEYNELVQDSQVTITLPDGSKQTFLYQPAPQGNQFYTSYYLPAFTRVGTTTGTLTAPGMSDTYLWSDGCGGFYDDFGEAYHPATLTLSTPDGTAYEIDTQSGTLRSISTHSGKLSFTSAGITGTGNVSVQINRDPAGRIKEVVDPSGNRILYNYDSQGNLIKVTNRQGGVVQFLYDETLSRRPHYLTEVIDPRGVSVMHSAFDPSTGQLSRVSDALGNVVGFTYRRDLGDGRSVESLTDANGVPTETVRDAQGHAVRQIRRVADNTNAALRRYQVTVFRYDANGHKTHQSIPFEVTGDANKYDYEPASLLWQSQQEFNTQGDVTKAVDALGNVTLYTYCYSSVGQVLSTTITDPLGNVTKREFDAWGNLTATTDAQGAVTRLTYNPSNGQLTEIRDGNGQLLGQFTYDASGRVATSTARDGVTTTVRYDAQGNQTLSYSYWTNPDNAQEKKTIVSRADFDGEGHVTGTRQYVLSGQLSFSSAAQLDSYTPVFATTTAYDAAGQVVRSVDQSGLATVNVYDARGLIIEVRRDARDTQGNAVVLITRTVYDDLGREWVTTDPYGQGETVYATRTTYDALGRVIGKERLQDVVIQITGTAPNLQAEYVEAGATLSSTQTVYDAAGRVDYTTDQYGTRTSHRYNAAGQQIEVRSQAKDENGVLRDIVTRTIYDKLGRAAVTTDAYVDGVTTTITGTRTTYDRVGHVVCTERLQGMSIGLTGSGATLQTVLLAAGTVISSSESTYDSLGQLVSSVGSHAPGQAGPTTNYEYDALGRQTAQVGPAVLDEISGQTVRLRTETVYGSDGRIAYTRENLRVVVNTPGVDASHVQTTAYDYDAQGRTIRTTYIDSSDVTRSYVTRSYDALGRLTSESQQTAAGNSNPLVKQYEYDGIGRLTAVVLPAVLDPSTGLQVHPRYEYAYDALGNQTLIRDPLGHETVFTYDTQGHQLTRTLPIGVSTTGDPNDFVESRHYDAQGRLAYEVSFEGVVTSYVYDDSQGASGRMVQKRFFPTLAAYNNGAGTPSEITQYTYDALGRQLKVVQDTDGNLATTADQRVTEQSYDTWGRLTMVASPEGVLHYVYSAVTGLQTQTWSASNKTTTAANATTNTLYAYDALGRLDSVTLNRRNGAAISAETTDYVYDLLGNVDQVRLPNGVVSDYDYDAFNRLEFLREFKDTNNNHKYDSGTDTFLSEYDYDVATDGRRSGVTEKTLVDSVLQETRIDWAYDNLGRLTHEAYDGPGTAQDFTADYAYDLAGNRLTKTTDQGSDNTVDEAVTSTYDANDRLLTEAKDVAGTVDDRFTRYEYGPGATTFFGGTGTQQTKQTVRSGLNDSGAVVERTTSSYNLQGRMSQTLLDPDGNGVDDTKLDYAYGDTGIRVSQTSTTDTDHDGSFSDETPVRTLYVEAGHNPTGYAQVLEEKNATGTVTKTYTLGLDVLAQQSPAIQSGGTLWLLSDGHGSTRGLSNAAGQLVSGQSYRYDAFGNRLDSATALTSLLYSGEQTDPLGLQYLRERYYDPTTGRFNGLDPFSGDLRDPLTLHKYLYCHSDGINYVDPSGREFELGGLMSSIGIQNVLTSLRLVTVNAVRAYAWRTIQNMGLGAILGAGFSAGIEATDPNGDVAAGVIRGAKWGALFGALPPFLWRTPVGKAVLGLFAIDATCHGVGSFMEGNILQGLLYLTGGAINGYAAYPRQVPSVLYAYVPKTMERVFSGGTRYVDANTIKTEGLIPGGVEGTIWATTMAPSEFNSLSNLGSFRIGGSWGADLTGEFPFLRTFVKNFDEGFVVRIKNTTGFSLSGTYWKALLGQYVASSPVAPADIEVLPMSGH